MNRTFLRMLVNLQGERKKEKYLFYLTLLCDLSLAFTFDIEKIDNKHQGDCGCLPVAWQPVSME